MEHSLYSIIGCKLLHAKPDFEQLIPELRQWEVDIGSWMGLVGRFDLAIGYGHFFWPGFKIHQDCVLFADCPIESFDEWMQHTDGDRSAVESVLNHRHIYGLFSNSQSVPTRQALVYLGRLLQDMWSCKLARDFPGRAIVVSFNEDFRESLLDYQITFFHKI